MVQSFGGGSPPMGQHQLASWSPPKAAKRNVALSPRSSSLLDPPPPDKLALLELMAASPDPIYGPNIGPGRFFSCCDLHIQINAGAPGSGVDQDEANEWWGDVVIFIEALNGSVASVVYRRKLSTLFAERNNQGPQLQGLFAQVRGRVAEGYRVWALNPNPANRPLPNVELVMVAWGDESATTPSDQAGRLVVDSWCRPDQTWTFYNRLFSSAGGVDLTLRLADGDNIVANPSGGRLMVTSITIGTYAAGFIVRVQEGAPAGGPYTDLWGAASSGQLVTNQQFNPPLVTRAGSCINLAASTTTNISITGFVE